MKRGSIFTFYSYKGGVGRTQALANVAVVLSQWGYRVLCIDWDLEAPGLHLYFNGRLKRWPCPGLVDLIHAYRESHSRKPGWREFITTVDTGNEQHLDLFPAGLLDDHYVSHTQSIQWDILYREHDFGEFLESLRKEWLEYYDFILIDSRTGITDSGGICTIHLPDYLVLFSTANRQSLDGVLEVANRAREQRNKLPYDRSKLLVLPVVTRFDQRVEYSLSQEWLEKFQRHFEAFQNEWKHKDVSNVSLLSLTKIPYIAHWSYGERISVLEETPPGASDPESISYAFQTLAGIIAQRLANTDLLVSNRDSYVASARRTAAIKREGVDRFLYDVYISYSPRDRRFAEELAESLNDRGVRTWVGHSDASISEAKSFGTQLGKAISSSKHFVFIAGPEISRYQHYESKSFLDATYDQSSALATESAYENPALTDTRLIIPVIRKGSDPKVLPGFMQSLQFLQENDQPIEQLADMLRKVLSQQAMPASQLKSYKQFGETIGGSGPDVSNLVSPSEQLASQAQGVGLKLSLREREVLKLIAEGKSTKEIAVTLNVSIKTVELHKTRIMKELRFRSTAQLIKYASALSLYREKA